MDSDEQDIARVERIMARKAAYTEQIMAELRQMSPEQLRRLHRDAEQRLRDIGTKT